MTQTVTEHTHDEDDVCVVQNEELNWNVTKGSDRKYLWFWPAFNLI